VSEPKTYPDDVCVIDPNTGHALAICDAEFYATDKDTQREYQKLLLAGNEIRRMPRDKAVAALKAGMKEPAP